MNIDLKKGDCLELMKNIPEESIDMILCDLPYGITDCKWDVKIPLEKLWEQYNRILKKNGCIALFGTEPFSSYLRISNIKNFKYDWIWNKMIGKGHLIVNYRPLQQHEIISIFSKGRNRINYYPVMEKREKDYNAKLISKSELYKVKKFSVEKCYTHRHPKSIIECFKSNKREKLHPTQKPFLLLEYLIKTYTLENETVLDNCMGAGSTGIACIHLNRNFIGIELDEKYFNIAKEQIEKESNEK
jgi:site-specific DNA-methyltransferase (adenine-specific)